MSLASMDGTVHSVDRASSARMDLAELTALAMTIVIGLGAFAWSFAALTDLSVMAGITPRLAWAGPIFVDGAIVQSAVALVSLQRRRRQGVVIPFATKAFFWGELFAAEFVSVIGNGLHAAESDQRILPATIAACVAGAAPLFGLAATHGLAALVEVPRSPAPPPASDSTPVHADSTRLDIEPTGLDTDRPALDTPTPKVGSGDQRAERDAQIHRRRADGESLRAIATAVGLSPSRVGQIIAAGTPAPRTTITEN